MFRALGLAALLVLGLPAATKLALMTAPQPAVLTAQDWLGVWRDGQNVVWISQNPDDFVTVVAAAYNREPAEGQINTPRCSSKRCSAATGCAIWPTRPRATPTSSMSAGS